MEENKQQEELITVAMDIIMNAGDARTAVMEALDAVMAGDDALCDSKMKEAHEFIAKAHQAQTDIMVKEANGEPTPYSMLLTHGQDTLMTITTEIHMSEKMILMYRTLENRLKDHGI